MDMGSKEPLGDGDITHGMCLLCSEEIIRAASAPPVTRDQEVCNGLSMGIFPETSRTSFLKE
jgi:hypothetical protein